HTRVPAGSPRAAASRDDARSSAVTVVRATSERSCVAIKLTLILHVAVSPKTARHPVMLLIARRLCGTRPPIVRPKPANSR
ncbi:MAG: hypothetical protein AAGK93_11730, partial [Pseudomonadota bacterium]